MLYFRSSLLLVVLTSAFGLAFGALQIVPGGTWTAVYYPLPFYHSCI